MGSGDSNSGPHCCTCVIYPLSHFPACTWLSNVDPGTWTRIIVPVWPARYQLSLLDMSLKCEYRPLLCLSVSNMTSSSQVISRAQLWVVSSSKHVSSFLRDQHPFTISFRACSSHILGFFSVSLWMCSLSNFLLCVKKNHLVLQGNQLVLFYPRGLTHY